MINLRDITIRHCVVGEMENNVYLLTSKKTGQQLLIDAADNAAAIKAMLEEASSDCAVRTRVKLIVTTHSHWDHVRALKEMTEFTGARTAAGTEDAADIETPTDLLLNAGRLGEVEGIELEVIKLRGHTPGSLALLYRDPEGTAHLFTGDSLFPGGVGNTFGDNKRFQQLLNDVTEQVFGRLEDDTIIYPGHGRRTTVGAERPHLEEWHARGW